MNKTTKKTNVKNKTTDKNKKSKMLSILLLNTINCNGLFI